MYSPRRGVASAALRNADTDWAMFGVLHPQQHHRRVPVLRWRVVRRRRQPVLPRLQRRVLGGAIGGYLVERGLSSTFYLVRRHACRVRAHRDRALRRGGAAHRPCACSRRGGRRARRRWCTASRESIVIVYGVTFMLLIAAAIEAFWSSARWLPHAVKYSVAALCWLAVLGYFMFQGRRAS